MSGKSVDFRFFLVDFQRNFKTRFVAKPREIIPKSVDFYPKIINF